MKVFISEKEKIEISSELTGNSEPNELFYEKLQFRDHARKIWQMLPVSFLEVNGFIKRK